MRLITQGERPVVHRDEELGTQIDKGAHRLLWVHMDVATARRFVGTDRHQGDIDFIAFADFLEAFEVGTITAMKHAFARGTDDIAAVIAVDVMNKTGAPMIRRSMNDFELVEGQLVPNLHLVGRRKSQTLDQGATAQGDDDALAGLENSQTRLVQVIEVGMGDQDQINLGHSP